MNSGNDRQDGVADHPAQSLERYAVNAVGLGLNANFPEQKLNLSVRFFEEFANRSTFQGFSLQFSGAIRF
jgi:hypothetical protein